MKKLIALLMTVFLLFVLAAPALADDGGPATNITDAASAANTEVVGYTHGLHWHWFQSQNSNGHSWNNSTYTKYLVIAYGDPSAPDSTGISRYIGQSTNGENITNVQHPYDVLDVQYLDELNWVSNPWSQSDPDNRDMIAADVTGDYGTIVTNALDGSTSLTDSDGVAHDLNFEIYKGLCITDPTYMRQSDLNINWSQYVHIWDPPTTHTWGCGIMYDIGSNMNLTLADAPAVYYKTVMLPPWHLPGLVVTPPDPTIQVGGTQQYDAQFYWNSSDENGHGEDVTTTNTNWTVTDSTVASIGAGNGLATGLAPGTTGVTATYQPPYGLPVSGNASLTVQGQQPSPTGGGGNGLTFQAVNEATVSTVPMYTLNGQPAEKITRPVNTAKWEDTVTATLTALQPPEPAPLNLNSYTFLGFDDWQIVDATLTYPAQNPDFSFDNPAEPVGNISPPESMTSQTNGPSQATATASFVENWSIDGYPVYDMLTHSQMAQQSKDYALTATYTVNYHYSYKYYVPPPPDSQGSGTWITVPDVSGTTGQLTATGDLLVNGAGAAPVTSGNKMVIVSIND